MSSMRRKQPVSVWTVRQVQFLERVRTSPSSPTRSARGRSSATISTDTRPFSTSVSMHRQGPAMSAVLPGSRRRVRLLKAGELACVVVTHDGSSVVRNGVLLGSGYPLGFQDRGVNQRAPERRRAAAAQRGGSILGAPGGRLCFVLRVLGEGSTRTRPGRPPARGRGVHQTCFWARRWAEASCLARRFFDGEVQAVHPLLVRRGRPLLKARLR